MKTRMLELTIFKIGTLLQQGFGELGAHIVAKQLTQTDIGMDFTINGRKIDIIFSVCRIKQFTETTECIMDEIIVFVNKVVKIIHECTKRYDGKATKNYGDKFLLTWRLPKVDDAIDLIKAENDEDSKIGDDDLKLDENLLAVDSKSKRAAAAARLAKERPDAGFESTSRGENEGNALLKKGPSDLMR